MIFYGNNDYRDALGNHGIMGQRWGVRNGPPYPLNQDVAYQKKQVLELSKELDTEWDYGVKFNGKRYFYEDDDWGEYNWDRDYRTVPLKQLKEDKIGTCWDFVNYQHDRLKKLGIRDSSYLLYMDLRTKEDPDRLITHTFTTFELDGKQYWLESAAYPKRGVHEIKNPRDVVNEMMGLYKSQDKPYSLFKYNPEGMDKGLTGNEFMERATADDNWIEDTFNGYLDESKGAKSNGRT